MRVALVCPAPKGSRLGNRVTALRWQAMLRDLGHRAFITDPGPAPRCDLLLALHARKSAESIRSVRALWPEAAVALALTGTDLYRDIHTDAAARQSLELADRLVVLQAGGADELPPRLRGKVRVVPQSAAVPSRVARPLVRVFEVAVVGHLRDVKDPLRAARAARLVPESSRLRVTHAGAALSSDHRAAALAEQRTNPRYRWLGERTPGEARRLIGRARALCVTSEMEGGANVVSEAIAAGTPVLASRIPALVSILGRDYPGFFPFGDTEALAKLFVRAEAAPGFLADLRRRCLRLRPALSPAKEKAALRQLLAELG